MKTKILSTTVFLTISFLLLTSFSFAQWETQNPLPTGNSMRDIFFTDSLNGWVVCGHDNYHEHQDQILHTINGGLDWETQSCDIEEGLRSVHFYDQSHGWAVGYNGTIIGTSDGGQNWSINDSPVMIDLYSVWALSSQSVIAVGLEGNILKSDDGGASWSIIPVGFSGNFYDLHFISSEEGWAVGDSLTVYHTVDGGNIWQQLTISLNDEWYTSVYFTDSLNGWATKPYFGWGQGTIIMHTSDGGINWEYQYNYYGSTLNSINFSDQYNGWVVGGSRILNTTDGGTSWQEHTLDVSGYGRLCCLGSEQVWAVFSRTIVNTSNAGLSWQDQLHIIDTFFEDVQFLDPLTGWAVGGKLMQTTDGGVNWTLNNSIGGNSLYFVDYLNGWIVNGGGKIYHTDDGGTTWEEQESGTDWELMSVCFLDPLNGWIVSKANYGDAIILHTNSGGNTWQIQDTVSSSLYSVMFLDENNGWAVGKDGNIFSTIDGGDTWTFNKIGEPYEFLLKSVYFINELTGWVAGSDGTIYNTLDGGVNWEEQNSGTDCRLNSVFFTDINNGWACGGDYHTPAEIIYTNDGGLTWQTQVYDIGRWFSSIFFTDPNNGWTVGFCGIIMHTYNGGFVDIKESQRIQNFKSEIQCYPNPFSESTTISYKLPQRSLVSIDIYNSNGQLVFKHKEEVKPEGQYEIIFDSQNIPTGIYFCSLQTNKGLQTKKIIKY